MSKRRISDRQSARIAKKQTHLRQESETNKVATRSGLVIKRYGRHAEIEETNGKRTLCSMRPNLGSLVSGDKVVWQVEGDGQGVVTSIYPRESVLGRPDKQGIIKPVAANITQLMIVVAPKPDISWPLLDSYLVVASHLKLNACIVLNKTDLDTQGLQLQLTEQYSPLGYSLLFTHKDNQHDNMLEQTLQNQVSVFVGQSGVGKSSLIENVLPPEHTIKIGAISEISELGRHTTSNSCYYHLPSGGALIDSPGVREFGLWHMPASDIAKGFVEFRPFLSECRFRNCNHLDAPSCALRLAVKNGLVTTQRYENYVKISTQFSK